jgi:DNA transformation protein and related proteins
MAERDMSAATHRDGFKNYILDQLRDLEDLYCRAMFGGFGLYAGEVFFGIIHKGRLYFKTDEKTREAYRIQAMEPFRPNGKQILKTYFEVPADVMEDPVEILEWAKRAARCGRSTSIWTW